MKRIFSILAIIALLSCNRNSSDNGTRIITVSIPPFKYFVEEIAGDDFKVNIMVPPGSNPHIYEPYPEQINRLRKSEAYISNGFLGFEMTWLDRFYEINKTMLKLSVGDKIDPVTSDTERREGHTEGTDPHYWVSPKCAVIIASSVKELLCNLNPSAREKYESNYATLLEKIPVGATIIFTLVIIWVIVRVIYQIIKGLNKRKEDITNNESRTAN